jgi:hypothetical protein
MRKGLLILILVFFPAANILLAQYPDLSPESRVSLLTCGPGPDIYSYFGHSAIRVTDPVLRIDRVYNYGTFDFNLPNFYGQFIDGKLYYMLSVVRYQGFVPDYISENRYIRERPLNISLSEKQELFRLLEINNLPENRHYWYDFFKDNCSTRVRDIVNIATGGKYQWPTEPVKPMSYRQLIWPYISVNHWARTGILLLLTSGADVKPAYSGYMFLPEHLDRQFGEAHLADGSLLCGPERVLFDAGYPKPRGNGLFHPYTVFSIIFLISLVVFLYRKTPVWLSKSWYSLIFMLTGLLGLLFSYMWFFSGHLVCHANLNLAWAFPFNLVLAISIWFPRAGQANRIYSRAMILLILLFFAIFAFWTQKIPFEAFLICFALLPGFFRFAGLQVFRQAKAQDQTN